MNMVKKCWKKCVKKGCHYDYMIFWKAFTSEKVKLSISTWLLQKRKAGTQ